MPSDDPLGTACRLEGVPSALAAARDGIDSLLRDRGHRRTTPAVTADALLHGAVASARLAGGSSTLEEVRRGAGDALAQSAVRLNAALLSLAPVLARSPLQALARMHTLAATGLAPPQDLGRPRADPAAVRAVQRLATDLLTPTAAPAIAVASVAHAELVVAAPFAVANDLVARAMERLVLVIRGVDPASVLVPEAGHWLMGSRYREALDDYREHGVAGCRAWLLYSCVALTTGVAESPLPRL
ncbi:MAG: oxidoreductase [Nocardioidaceae bacterium]